jgi:hypothetical protein
VARFKIGDNEYRSDKLDALTQFHVSRRLLPVLTSFTDVMVNLGPEAVAALVGGEDESAGALSNALGDLAAMRPLLEAVAKMPDEDANYVLNSALKVTHRANLAPSGEIASWSPVWNTAAKRVMFDDIEMMEMLQIARAVLTESLGRFFFAPPSSLSA